jgi:hypothetical protein
MTKDEFRAALMAEAEARVNELVEGREDGKPMTLTEMEDLVLDVRGKIGERMLELLIERQEASQIRPTPTSAESGKPMHNKGKKRRR